MERSGYFKKGNGLGITLRIIENVCEVSKSRCNFSQSSHIPMAVLKAWLDLQYLRLLNSCCVERKFFHVNPPPDILIFSVLSYTPRMMRSLAYILYSAMQKTDLLGVESWYRWARNRFRIQSRCLYHAVRRECSIE